MNAIDKHIEELTNENSRLRLLVDNLTNNQIEIPTQGEMINFVGEMLVRQGMLDGTGTFLGYLLLLERANYYAGRINFDCDGRMRWILYNVLYYGCLNGKSVLGRDKGYGRVGFYISGTDDEVEVSPINLLGVQNFDNKNIKLKSDECVIYQWRQEGWGLWVVGGEAVSKVCEFINLLENQITGKVKKGVVHTDDMQLGNLVKDSFVNKNNSIVVLPNNVEVQALNTPEVDIHQLGEMIQNYQDYFDYHLMGIRSTSVSGGSGGDRDLVPNQNITTLKANKTEYGFDLFIEMLMDDIREVFGKDIHGENENLILRDTIANTTESSNESKEGLENDIMG